MKKLVFLIAVSSVAVHLPAQTISKKLHAAYQAFENDPQLSNALASLYVVNAKTGKVVFDKNSRVGLATASTLKIITAATAYELLGKDFRYETKFGYTGTIRDHVLRGDLYMKPAGDPTFGSWRWSSTSDTVIFNRLTSEVERLNITSFGNMVIDERGWNSEWTPDGWIWQDIGNYYGAGASGFNWRENQFDVVMKSGKQIGDPVTIVRTKPDVPVALSCLVTSARKGSGDNSYVYYPLLGGGGVVRGTIPVNEEAFTISASNPVAKTTFAASFAQHLALKLKLRQTHFDSQAADTTIVFSHFSPSLDSMVYWFLKKSINLYGEGFTRTFAYRENGSGETDKGVSIITKFWKEKGIAPTELNMVDGSGLSPLNRVTTHAQVTVLKYAKGQPWFDGYYNAFPLYNGMKMKSGTISDVKGFCGFQTSKDGNEYIFSFLVNNYNGSASALVQKMYKVLDQLK